MGQKDVIAELVDGKGRLYSEDAGADIARDTPQPLFHWLLTSLLLSARISARNATDAARGLKTERLHTVKALLESDRQMRIRTLNKHGYARYDTRTAEYIEEAARVARDDYGGDLRRLRDAGGDADGIIRRLMAFKGIGAVGAEIFCREAQLVWDPLYPRLQGPAAEAAGHFGLPTEAGGLAKLAGSRERFVRLAAALTRAELEGTSDTLAKEASSHGG